MLLCRSWRPLSRLRLPLNQCIRFNSTNGNSTDYKPELLQPLTQQQPLHQSPENHLQQPSRQQQQQPEEQDEEEIDEAVRQDKEDEFSDESEVLTPLRRLRWSKEKVFVFHSKSNDPYFNLAIEDHIFQRAQFGTSVLFTYINKPCVVIGRNQTPWAEVNLPLLQTDEYKHIKFLRRFSGGGTVYHDLGNVCWYLLTPRMRFDRDAGLHMVSRVLGEMGVKATVNDRHDLVIPYRIHQGEDQGDTSELVDHKISGSAYKITGRRAYHHATLLCDADLSKISPLLNSPMADILERGGVSSVKSRVTNTGVNKQQFIKNLEKEFIKVYSDGDTEAVAEPYTFGDEERHELRNSTVPGLVGQMRGKHFLFEGTPRFVINIHDQPVLPAIKTNLGIIHSPKLPPSTRFRLDVRAGKVIDSAVSFSSDPEWAVVQSQESVRHFRGSPFTGTDIRHRLEKMATANDKQEEMQHLGVWLEAAIGPTWGAKTFAPGMTKLADAFNPTIMPRTGPVIRKYAISTPVDQPHPMAKKLSDRAAREAEEHTMDAIPPQPDVTRREKKRIRKVHSESWDEEDPPNFP